MAINKISIIGAGNIGGALAHLALLKNIGDIILFDIINGLPQGKALDLCHCKPIENADNRILGTNNYADIIDSNIVIVSAGVLNKPGMSNDDLIEINSRMMLTIGSAIKEHCPDAFVICITNPLDVMIRILHEASGLKNNMIVGIANVLASVRFCMYLSWEFNISVKDITSYILGGIGNMMVPLIEMTTIGGISLKTMIKNNKITQPILDNIISKIRTCDKEITNLSKTGTAFYAPASIAIAIAESYLLDKKRIFSCTIKLKIGEYNVKSPIFLAVPSKIGISGVEEILELTLSDEEKAGIKKAIDSITYLNNIADKLLH